MSGGEFSSTCHMIDSFLPSSAVTIFFFFFLYFSGGFVFSSQNCLKMLRLEVTIYGISRSPGGSRGDGKNCRSRLEAQGSSPALLLTFG